MTRKPKFDESYKYPCHCGDSYEAHASNPMGFNHGYVEEIPPPLREGWAWLINTTKWHYFHDKKSLCGRWMLPLHSGDDLEQGNDNSTDNCRSCRVALEKERLKQRL